ncbi:MAG: tRNA (cytidine(34)-2'-O)-methyltransferase [Pirellulaceae bacterium]|nr:tRNA (cytidine(34)-2'-O)-methyltransferase [Pirellulaceae bacterium]
MSNSDQTRLHIVLFQPEIPQNTGNIGRTCVALGAKLWIVRPAGFRLDSTQLKRAGLDYWEHLLWEAVDNWPTLLEQIDVQRCWFLTKFAKRSYTNARYSQGDVLVFGSETSGLPESIRRKHEDRTLAIPMPGPVRSLNLAVSVGIVAYEAYRQIQMA